MSICQDQKFANHYCSTFLQMWFYTKGSHIANESKSQSDEQLQACNYNYNYKCCPNSGIVVVAIVQDRNHQEGPYLNLL